MGGALIGAVVASAALEQEGYGAAFLAIAVVTGLLHLLSYGLRSRGEELASLRGA
jgi:hypothetical protein